METPSSATARRITRSQTLASKTKPNSSSSKKMQVSDKNQRSKSSQDRSALIDITNDSPIVGLASGSLKTPVSKQSNRWKKTPGSGEALLRGQVKSLLQRVEEEAVISKFSLEFCGVGSICDGENVTIKAFSPAGILAPTPANTPQVNAFSAQLESVSKLPIEDQLETSQVKVEENEKDEITRSLFLDFSEKSGSSSSSDSSVVTYQGTETTVEKSALTEDDDASLWSIQVNLSTRDEDEEEENEADDVIIPDDIEQEEDDDDGDYEYDDVMEELCEGMNNMSVVGVGLPTPKGKHTRFDYDSDDELVGEVLLLKGLPTPKGKHLRFQDDADDDEEEEH